MERPHLESDPIVTPAHEALVDQGLPAVDIEELAHKEAVGIAAFALRNPHFIIVGCLIIVLLGTLALLTLPKDLLPASNNPAVQVISFYPGMPVEHVATNLSSRLERGTGQAIGIERQESRSIVGVSVVRNFFGAGSDLNAAMSQTTSLVMSALRRLPPGTQPPVIMPFDPMASVPLALVAVSGDRSEKDLYDTARYEVRSGIQAVPGAMAPTVMGGSERQVLIFLKPKPLAAFNFSPLEVINRVTGMETFIPAGGVNIGSKYYQIVSNGIVEKVEEMNQFPLRSQNGVTVSLGQVATVKDAAKIQTNMVLIDGKAQVYVPVYRQPGANSLQVVADVRRAMSKLGQNLAGTVLTVVADQSVFITHAIESITHETLIGGGLAALMVLLFLGSPRATFAIVLSLPLSILCAFLGLKATGQTINAMTLGGLALSIGVLVDNSIVVIENIIHKLDSGYSPKMAALAGSREVALPVLSATICTLVVFFPIVFLSGIVQILFSALAKAVTFAMLGSYLVALTVIPLFSSVYLRAAAQGRSMSRFNPLCWTQWLLVKVTDVYGMMLKATLRWRWVVLPIVLLFLAGGASMYRQIGYELFPRADAGNFIMNVRLPSGTRIENTVAKAKLIEASLRQWIPASDLSMVITNAGVYAGYPAAFTPNSGSQDFFFNVELSDHREHTSQYYAQLIRERLPKEYPDVEIGIGLGGLLTSALNGGLRSPIDVQIEGKEQSIELKIAQELKTKVKGLAGVVDLRIQQRLDAPQIALDIDRVKAARLGLNEEEAIKNTVSAVSSSSSFNSAIWVDPKSGVDYLLGVQFQESDMTTLDDLGNISITGSTQSRSVPLKRIATLKYETGPSEINHVNLKQAVDLFLDAQGRDIGRLATEVGAKVAELALPQGYSVNIRGEISEMQRSVVALSGGFLLAATLVYLILVIQFRSFVMPLVIMAVVPMGLVGIVVMLAVTKTYFSIQAAIGAIFMIGIAVANGVLLVEFIIQKLNAGEPVEQAIVQGAMARLRPILMTSLASMLGLIPMAIGLGHGAEANIPLGRAVIGGQLLSTFLTLFIVPIIFLLVRGGRKVKPSGRAAAVAALLLLGLAAMSLGAPRGEARELTLAQVLQEAAVTSPTVKSGQAREAAAQAGVAIVKSAVEPTLALQAIDSLGFPGSTGMLGIGGEMGSPYRSGLAAGLVATQQLWDFGKNDADVLVAKQQISVAREERRLAEQEARLAALHAFFECAKLEGQARFYHQLTSDAEGIASEVKAFVRTGQRSIVDRYLAAAQVEEATTAAAEATAKLSEAYKTLALIMGSAATDFSCAPIATLESEPATAVVLSEGPDSNPYIQQAVARADVDRARLESIRAELMPKVNLLASVGVMERSRLVHKAPYAVGIGFSWPLLDGSRRDAEMQRGAALISGDDYTIAARQLSVAQLLSHYEQVISGARSKLQHLHGELKLAKKAFNLAKSRYHSAEGSLTDLRETLRNLSRIVAAINDAEATRQDAEGSKALVGSGLAVPR